MGVMDEKNDDHWATEEHIEDVSSEKRGDISVLEGIEETASSKAAWLITVTLSLCGFLFGYDTGYISSVLVSIGTDLGHELSSSEQELVTSLTSGGALVGAVFAGLTADRYGRKMPIWVACVIFVIGTVLQTAAYSVPQFAVGRFVVGLGVGSASMIAPMYIGELAPAKFRGRMIAFNNTSVTFGQLVASAIGAGLAEVPAGGWRGTVGIGALPAIALGILLFWCPESPRQLIAHGQVEEAERVLQRLYKTSSEDQRLTKIRAIEMDIEQASTGIAAESLWTSFKRIFNTPASGRAIFTACFVMAISQLGGFNTLMYYSATLFGIVGFSNAAAVAIVVSGTNFLFSIVNLLLVDRFGRRQLLVVTILGMSVCMLIAAVAFSFIPIDLQTLKLIGDSAGPWGILVLVTIIFYVAFFSSGVATIAWIGTELIPFEVRALGTMLNTVTCWSTNIIISSTFLSMMKGITPSGAFGFYCGICLIGWLFVLFFYPDVKGMDLETIRNVFQSGFGLKYSKRWQKENKHVRKIATEQALGH